MVGSIRILLVPENILRLDVAMPSEERFVFGVHDGAGIMDPMYCAKKTRALTSDPDNQRAARFSAALFSVAEVVLPIGEEITLCPWKEQRVTSAMPKREEKFDCVGFLAAQFAKHGNFTLEFLFFVGC